MILHTQILFLNDCLASQRTSVTLGGITRSVCSGEAGRSPPRKGRETDGWLLCYSHYLLGHEQILSEKYTCDWCESIAATSPIQEGWRLLHFCVSKNAMPMC